MRAVLVFSLLSSFALAVLLTGCDALRAPFETGHVQAQQEEPSPAPRVQVAVRELAGLRYVEIQPLGADERTPLPMVVYLHGRGDRPHPPPAGETFLGLEEPVRVLMPEAPEPFHEGFTWMPVSARDGESPELNAGLVRSTERLEGLLSAARRRYATYGRPIVMGFSQGGMLSLNLALTSPEQVGFAIPMAGWLPPSLQPPSRAPHRLYPEIRMIHGRDDPILRIERTRGAVEHLRDKGYPVHLTELKQLGHESDRRMYEQVQSWLREALERTPRELDGSQMS